MASPQLENADKNAGLPDTILWTASIAFLFTLVVSTAVLLFYALPPETLRDIGKTHGRLLLGLPSSAMMSLTVISLLRATSGPIEFEAPGFKFRGASGPVVLWIFAFLACVAGVVALW